MKNSPYKDYLKGEGALAMALALGEITTLPVAEIRVEGACSRRLHFAVMVGDACFLDARGMQSLGPASLDGWDPSTERLQMKALSKHCIESMRETIGLGRIKAAKRYARGSQPIAAGVKEATLFVDTAQGALFLPAGQ